MTVQGSYLINTTAVTSGEYVSEGVSFTAQLNNSITITPTLSAEVTGMYMAGMRQGYFVFKPMSNLSVGLRQMLLKNKMTLSLNINDILNTQGTKVSAQYDNVNYNFREKWDSRFVNLTLRYNFGSTTVRAARNRTTGIEEETNRAGGR